MVLYKKAVFPILILIFSIGYFIEAITLGPPLAEGGIVGPSFIPLVLGVFSIFFSLILTTRALSAVKSAAKLPQKAVEHQPVEAPTQPSSLPVLTILAIAIYIVLFSLVGYVLSSLPFVFSIITIFSDKNKWILKCVLSAAIVAFGYLVFEQLFGVRLPTFRG